MIEQPYKGDLQEMVRDARESALHEQCAVLESLATELGFHESSHTKTLRSLCVLNHGNLVPEAFTAWREEAELSVNAIQEGDAFRNAQIGLLIVEAIVHLHTNRPDAYHEAIDDAILYASNLGIENVVERLKGI